MEDFLSPELSRKRKFCDTIARELYAPNPSTIWLDTVATWTQTVGGYTRTSDPVDPSVLPRTSLRGNSLQTPAEVPNGENDASTQRVLRQPFAAEEDEGWSD